MVPFYKVVVCEINWIYYTFILKYEKIPHFYEYINDCKKEIMVSMFSLDEIHYKYEKDCYDASELAELTEVFYNHNYYKRENINDTIFVKKSLFISNEDKQKFIKDSKNKNRV